jgi:hypothetical protein
MLAGGRRGHRRLRRAARAWAIRWRRCAARHCAPPGADGRSLVLVISDGLDTGRARGDLARELDWLTHRCRRLALANPLRFEGYAPLARGRRGAAPGTRTRCWRVAQPGGQAAGTWRAAGGAAREIRTKQETKDMEMQALARLAGVAQQYREALNDPKC